MKKLYSLTILCILLSVTLNAQKFKIKNYTFENQNFTDEHVEIPEIFKDKNEIILMKDEKIEINTNESNVLQFYMLHLKTMVNSDEAIEKNNRIYISASESEYILENKCRVILPNNEILILNEEDIHEEINEETGSKYEYYAVNGLVKGSIIERIYKSSQIPNFKGVNVNFQDDAPVLRQSFELIYPHHLDFAYKCYNGLTEPILDEKKYTNKRSLFINEKNIAPLPSSEKYSNLVKNRKRIILKLSENTANNTSNFYNYKDFVRTFYENIKLSPSKKERKQLNNFLSSINSSDTRSKVLQLENSIKKTFAFNRNSDYQESLKDFFKTKQLNLNNTIQLYKICLDQLDIENQIVLTSNRYRYYFDKEFETSANLREVLFYIPELDIYLDPGDISTRIPVFSYGHGHTNGLFIKEKEFGGAIMAVSEVRYIELPGIDVTKDSMFIKVDFTDGVDQPKLTSRLVFGGYSGYGYQPIKDYIAADKYDEFLQTVGENYCPGITDFDISSKYGGLDYMGLENFELNISANLKETIQYAGDKILLKLGELIGKQIELYQVEKRVLPLEINYPHFYFRQLQVILPEGYEVANPEVADMNYSTTIDGQEGAKFTSKGSVIGNHYVIDNIEFYKSVEYPLEVFEDYRKVLNAAADFNKITLVINKK